VQLEKLDDEIHEDVLLLKIDTEGFEVCLGLDCFPLLPHLISLSFLSFCIAASLQGDDKRYQKLQD